MALGKEDILRASRGERIDIPVELYGRPGSRDERSPEDRVLRRTVDWFKEFMDPKDWRRRRDAAMVRLHRAAYGMPLPDPKGRFFDEGDVFGWYLFQADAYLDHPWNFEGVFGARVVPVFTAIGRDLDLLRSIPDVEDRVRRMIHANRKQPNGTLFELLVAQAYARTGASVSFRDETPGGGKSHDLDVVLCGRRYAVECKRMEVGAYGERERERMRRLWFPVAHELQVRGLNVFGNVDFLVPLDEVPDTYLADKAAAWYVGGRPSKLWCDDVSEGVIGELDLDPLRRVLKEEDVMTTGTRLLELLSGRHVRHGSYLQNILGEQGTTPRHIGECTQALLLRWQSSSAAAIRGKARDVLRMVAEANDQLPDDAHGIIHVGFEAVEGDHVEAARFERIQRSLTGFNPKGRPLRYMHCHYFVPESPPEGGWEIDETVQTIGVGGDIPPPLPKPFLVLHPGDPGRTGKHWEG